MRWWIGPFVLWIVAVLVGCEPEPTEEVVVTTGDEVRIAPGTQATFGDLLIAAGSIWDEPYTTAEGTPRTGLTAGLWLSFLDRPENERRERVHPGGLVRADPYLIEIVSIAENGVRIRVTRMPGGG